MDKISDRQKLQWLTTTVAASERMIINKKGLQALRCTRSRPRHQIQQPSFGTFDKLPFELLYLIFRHLTCKDLEALASCSTGGHITVLAFPQYHALLKHDPGTLAILKTTGLARSFTTMQIYKTFVNPLCTTCGQFGGYVFLPSFSRCCLHCAETEPMFLLISRDEAGNEFGVREKGIFDSLPQLNTIKGYYSSSDDRIQHHAKSLTLFGREMVERLRSPRHIVLAALARHRRRDMGDNLLQMCQQHLALEMKTHQRYMALMALPCFIPKSDSTEKGVYCIGCITRAREHVFCRRNHMSENRRHKVTLEIQVTDGMDTQCWPQEFSDQCLLVTERDRLHDSRQVLDHLEGCEAAQALLEMRWTNS